jgi:hypothetical protein
MTMQFDDDRRQVREAFAAALAGFDRSRPRW